MGLADQRLGPVGVAADRGAREAEGHREVHQTRLDPVVQVPLDAQPLLGGGVDRALAALGELGHLLAQLVLGAGDQAAGEAAVGERAEGQHDRAEHERDGADPRQRPARQLEPADPDGAAQQRELPAGPAQPQQRERDEQEGAGREHREVMVQDAAPERAGAQLEPPVLQPARRSGAVRAPPGGEVHPDAVHGDRAALLDAHRPLHQQQPRDQQQQPAPERRQRAQAGDEHEDAHHAPGDAQHPADDHGGQCGGGDARPCGGRGLLARLVHGPTLDVRRRRVPPGPPSQRTGDSPRPSPCGTAHGARPRPRTWRRTMRGCGSMGP